MSAREELHRLAGTARWDEDSTEHFSAALDAYRAEVLRVAAADICGLRPLMIGDSARMLVVEIAMCIRRMAKWETS